MGLLGLLGSLTASIVALTIAIIGWRKADARDVASKADADRGERVRVLAELLELHALSMSGTTSDRRAQMRARLLVLPGHLATVLRLDLGLRHTMVGVPLDAVSAARLPESEKPEAGLKWVIFERSSAVRRGSFAARPEWIEAELVYDIAGVKGDDQEAVLVALKKDVRDLGTAVAAEIQRQRGSEES